MDTSAISTPGRTGGIFSATGRAKFSDNPFLRLLIQEMRSQTPLQPVDNASFMQQMSSFSSMEEQRQLNGNLLKLLDFQGALARIQGLSQGSSLLGKEVSFATADGKKGSGLVDSVFVNDEGDVRLELGDTEISLRQVTGIRTSKK